jgi:xanthine/uracil permease
MMVPISFQSLHVVIVAVVVVVVVAVVGYRLEKPLYYVVVILGRAVGCLLSCNLCRASEASARPRHGVQSLVHPHLPYIYLEVPWWIAMSTVERL